MSQAATKKRPSTTVSQLMAQYFEIMENRDQDAVMKDPIIALHTKACESMIGMRKLQVKLHQLDKKSAERLNQVDKVHTLWVVTYLYTLKNYGINILVQEPPAARGEDPAKKMKQRMSMLITQDTTVWSYEDKSQFKLKQPMVRIVPTSRGLHMELRKITGLEGDTVRTVLKDHWCFNADDMMAKVNKAEIREKLVSSGFDLASV